MAALDARDGTRGDSAADEALMVLVREHLQVATVDELVEARLLLLDEMIRRAEDDAS
jgi:hypothetical protein